MAKKEQYINFDEYIRQGEPEKRKRAEAWRVAIGLQAVDGLKTSEYLQDTARRNIEGEISIDEARERANYRNLAKNISYEPIFLVRFFRNLLLGENNTLKNRYMMINGPEEWKMPENEQAEDKYRTSNEQVTEQVCSIIVGIGQERLTLKQLMDKIGMKHRPNFTENYLTPAITGGYVRLLYPDKPRHPRQKYLLTVKGLALYNDLNH